jgi:hypothetical protein
MKGYSHLIRILHSELVFIYCLYCLIETITPSCKLAVLTKSQLSLFSDQCCLHCLLTMLCLGIALHTMTMMTSCFHQRSTHAASVAAHYSPTTIRLTTLNLWPRRGMSRSRRSGPPDRIHESLLVTCYRVRTMLSLLDHRGLVQANNQGASHALFSFSTVHIREVRPGTHSDWQRQITLALQ